jgi:NADPH-dependent curcumin reductase
MALSFDQANSCTSKFPSVLERSLTARVKLGEVMRCIGLAEIVESKTPEFKKGDKITGLVGIQDYVVIDPRDKAHLFQKIPAMSPIPRFSASSESPA